MESQRFLTSITVLPTRTDRWNCSLPVSVPLSTTAGLILPHRKKKSSVGSVPSKISGWFPLTCGIFTLWKNFGGSLLTYIRTYNQTPHSFPKGLSPQERFFQEPELISRLSDELIENSFLLEIERRVSADSVIVIDQMEYEVDYRFVKQRITLRYTPDRKDIFIVEADGSLTPICLLNKQENSCHHH